MKKILYISYDGMTDPLGQSQIVPYLQGLSKFGYRFTILSFEKPERFAKQEKFIRSMLDASSIQWVPMRFTTKPPLLSKFYDAIRMRRKAFALQRTEKFDMVHCRSYIAADIGLAMKKKFGTKFFFDMRGFWADEKKDAGSWNQSNLVFRQVYRYYKKREVQYIRHADHIISLTEAGRKEMLTWPAYDAHVPVKVIPCCADMDHFSVTDAAQKIKARELLGIGKEALVVSYLGSVGAWYMLNEMLDFFVQVKNKYPNAIFLFVTHSSAGMIRGEANKKGIPEKDMLITEASRQEVPVFIKASDINVSFIKPVYSKISSSPTKLAEVLSMGIPVVSNSGVGDVKEIIETTGAGIVIDEFTNESYDRAVDALPSLIAKDPHSIRGKITGLFSLEKGVSLYKEAYAKVFGSPASISEA